MSPRAAGPEGAAAIGVLSVVSEIYPLVKTGGLADVAGALPAALAAEEVAVTTLVPGYPAVLDALDAATNVYGLADLFGGGARLLRGRAAGLDLLVIDAPHLYGRPGNPYLGPDGREWPDNALRFAALGAVAALAGRGAVTGLAPDVVHAHDWQAGLAAAYLHYGETPGLPPRPRTVMTAHNLAFQGQFPARLLGRLGLPPHAYAIDGVEYYGSIGYLKAGLALSDWITTVSPSYAEEIRTPEGGMGLDGLLRHRADALTGILNGIDVAVWNPETDALVPQCYGAARLAGRAANKAALQQRLGLAASPEALLLGVVSRLTWQKGIDLVLESVPTLLAAGAQLAVLGAGDPALEAALRSAAAAAPGGLGVVVAQDEKLAHLIQAGADALLVPSRFEPCGLTQLCALRYGAVPVVARVGGLADSIIDANDAALAAGVATGLQFAPVTRERFEAALGHTARLWRDPTLWRQLQRNAMAADVSWRRPAARYAALYRALLAAAAA